MPRGLLHPPRGGAGRACVRLAASIARAHPAAGQLKACGIHRALRNYGTQCPPLAHGRVAVFYLRPHGLWRAHTREWGCVRSCVAYLGRIRGLVAAAGP